MTEKNLLNNLVSVTMFNQGQASKIFNRLQDEKQIVVLKNNVPTAVLLSPDEYTLQPNNKTCFSKYDIFRVTVFRSVPANTFELNCA